MAHCVCPVKVQDQSHGPATTGQALVSGTAGSPTGERKVGLQDPRESVGNECEQRFRVRMCCCPSQGEVQGPPAMGRGVTGKHNEDVCHATGERRRDIINQIKNILNDFDERSCQATPLQGPGQNSTRRLGEIDEYTRLHCQSWKPPNPRPPLITSVQTHEIRPTEDYARMAINNNEYITYVDARHKPPPPSCDCAKRNGLQDQCENPACKPPTEQCLASNPGPCCPPSMGSTGRSSQSGAQARGFVQVPKQPSPPRQMFTLGLPSKGEEMVCFCDAEPDNLPSGQKYLCCPAPIGGCRN